jgi:hypothetical protein
MARHNRQARRNRRASEVADNGASRLFRETVQEVRTAISANGIPWEVRLMTRHAASGGVSFETGTEGNVKGGARMMRGGVKIVLDEPVKIEGGVIKAKRSGRFKAVDVQAMDAAALERARKEGKKAARAEARAAGLFPVVSAIKPEVKQGPKLPKEIREKIAAARKAAKLERPVKQSVRPRTIGTLRLKARDIVTDVAQGLLATTEQSK